MIFHIHSTINKNLIQLKKQILLKIRRTLSEFKKFLDKAILLLYNMCKVYKLYTFKVILWIKILK